MANAITAGELYEQINAGNVPEILDLRSSGEASSAPIVGRRPVAVRNIPVYAVVDELDREAERVRDGAVVVCGQGNGSELVVAELAARGLHTRSLEGGTDAWARFLAPVEFDNRSDGLQTWQLQRPAKGCLSYVVGVPGERCVVVDPSRHLGAYLDLAAAQSMSIEHVVETHLHADHISGGPELSRRLGIPYHLPAEDAGASSPYSSQLLRDGDGFDLGSASVRVVSVHVPGHTPGSIALVVGERLVLVGDTVFVRGVGRPDLTGHADELARDLFHSLHERLATFDPETYLAPAHWSTHEEFDHLGLVRTTLRDAFDSDLLRDQAEEEFVREVVNSLPAAPEEYDTIRLVNAGLRTLGEDELELLDVGMNRCAG